MLASSPLSMATRGGRCAPCQPPIAARPQPLRSEPPHAALGLRMPHAARRRGTEGFRTAATGPVGHRTERLVGLANEFIRYWIEGARDGPTDEVLARLRSVTDEGIVVKTAHLLGKAEFRGLGGLRDKLTLDQDREGTMRPVRSVLCAANEEHDSVFCLLDFEGGAADEEQGTGVEKMRHKTRGLVKFDAMLDDSVCQVTALTERWQLSPSDAAHLALRAHAGEPQDEQKSAALQAALELAGAAYFGAKQIEEISAQEYRAREALRNIDRWCQARCSGEDEAALLDQALSQHEYRRSLNFKLWDAYGMLPLLCGLEQEVGGVPHSCIMFLPQLLDNLRNGKARYHITCTLLDKAVCPHHNIGFAHWRAHLRPLAGDGDGGAQEAAGEEEWTQEALELHMFDEEGKIRETWMLRDPTVDEAKMLEAVEARETVKVAG